MNFSFPIKFSGLCIYSPNGRYFVMSKGVEAIVNNHLTFNFTDL